MAELGEDDRARLQRLSDVEEIRTLIAEYRRQLDARDYPAYSALFARDGEFVGNVGRATGPAAIEAMLVESLGPRIEAPGPTAFHLVANSIISVDGDTATGTSTFVVLRRGAGDVVEFQSMGEYDDVFVREDGRWRIQTRRAGLDIPDLKPPR
jgi:ketosteroid isomerase-like protein